MHRPFAFMKSFFGDPAFSVITSAAIKFEIYSTY